MNSSQNGRKIFRKFILTQNKKFSSLLLALVLRNMCKSKRWGMKKHFLNQIKVIKNL